MANSLQAIWRSSINLSDSLWLKPNKTAPCQTLCVSEKRVVASGSFPSSLAVFCCYSTSDSSQALSQFVTGWKRYRSGIKRASRRLAFCTLLKTSRSVTELPENLEKEAHKYFDQVVITVRSGDGGNGSVLSIPRPPAPPPKGMANKKTASKFSPKETPKKKKMGPMKKDADGAVVLPNGGDGGDVIIVADQSVDTLLEFHRKKRHNAKRGANVDDMGKLSPMLRDGAAAPTLRISVPVGTVVKRKRGGKLIADLASPGEEILVARGGRGGISMLEIPKANTTHLRAKVKKINAPTMTDPDDKILTLGTSGEEIALELILRVVADVGLVGLPNAGKSSLLAAVTRATPDIADYPFTTLMPNLGCIEGNQDKEDGGYAMGPTLADLPGLIKGAHLGKGLGRMFLRHLRRTRLLVHVVDASAENPIHDYKTLREELHMYNPEYTSRPHIVVLNKLDLPEAKSQFEDLHQQISSLSYIYSETTSGQEHSTGFDSMVLNSNGLPRKMSSEQASKFQTEIESRGLLDKEADTVSRPVAVVGLSARYGLGVEALLKQISLALERGGGQVQIKTKDKPRAVLYNPPQWQL